MCYRLDVTDLVINIDPEDKKALNKLLQMEDQGRLEAESFLEEAKSRFAEYARALDLIGGVSWSEKALSLSGDGVHAIYFFDERAAKDNPRSLTLREFIVVRSFFCWFSSMLLVITKQKKPTMFLHDSEIGFHFDWKLSAVQNRLLSEFFEVRDHEEIERLLKEFMTPTGVTAQLKKGEIYLDDELLVRYNKRQGKITCLGTTKEIGLAIVSFYCWLVDQLERGDDPLLL